MKTAGTTTISSARSSIKEPLKRRLTVYFADDKVARYENLGVPTQADLEQLERDLRKARGRDQGERRKQRLWQRMSEPRQTGDGYDRLRRFDASEAEKAPDPVPPSAPAARSRRDSFGSNLSGR